MSKLDGVASMRLASLLHARFNALWKSGCIFQHDLEAVSLEVEATSLKAVFDSFSRFAVPSGRCRFWEVGIPSGSIFALDGCQERIQKASESLRNLHSTACVILETPEDDWSRDKANLLAITMEAIENDDPIVIRLTPTSQSLPVELEHLSQLLGYDIHVIQFPPGEIYDRPPTDRLWTISATLSEQEMTEMLMKIVIGSARNGNTEQETGRWEYLCAFLSARSETDLRRLVPMKYDHVSGNSLTLIRNPSIHLLGELPPLGSCVRMTVTDIVYDDYVQSAVVQINGIIRRPSSIIRPHRIVLSCRDPIGQLDSQPTTTGTSHEDLPSRLEIDGTLGLLVSRHHKRPPRKVICRECLKQDVPYDQSLTVSDVQWVPFDGNQDITVLHVFDFDGTLMSSPDEFTGKREYQDALGIPYPHLGWYGRIESLLPPVRVLPGPALRDCHLHYGRIASWTVVLTGRIKRVRSAIQAVLRSYNVDYDELICKAGYSDTQIFKIKTIMELLRRFQKAKKVKIWEDNVENLAEMYDLKHSLIGRVDVEIIEAPVMPPPRSLQNDFFSWEERRYLKGIASYLEAEGKLPNREYWLYAETGIELLVETWRQALGVDCFLKDLFFVLGPYAFGIRHTVDLRLLTPGRLSQDDCMARLGSLLTEMKIDWSTAGSMVQVKLRFTGCCPIDYRLGFVRIEDTVISKALVSSSDLIHWLSPEDTGSQRAAEMWKTIEKVEKAGEVRAVRRMIRAALGMTDRILMLNEQKTEHPDRVAFYPIHRMASFLNQYERWHDASVDNFCLEFVRYMGQPNPSKDDEDATMWEAISAKMQEIQIMMDMVGRQFPSNSDDLHWIEIHRGLNVTIPS